MSQRKLALLVLYGLIVLFLQFRPSYDVDLFWQLKAGQLMLQRGELVRNEPFTATHAGEPVPPIAWGSQVLYAVLYGIGSWRLLHQANVLVFAGGFLVAALTVRRRDTSTFAGLLALSLGMLVALPHCEIRPHSFGVLGFALLLWMAQLEIRAWWKLIPAAAVLLVWQNMHPSVIVAAVTIAAQAGAGWLRFLLDRRAAKPWFLSLLALLAALSTLATPMGLGLFESSDHNRQISRELRVTEWLPLWDPATWSRGAWLVWVALAVSLVLLIRVRRRVRLEDLAALLVLTAAALVYYRLSLFLAVVMVPVWSRWLAQARAAASPAPTGEAPVRPLRAAGVVGAVLLCALVVPRLLHLRLFDRQLPFAAMDRMREIGVRGVIYNYREWGGPLIWKGHPDWKVTIDGRLYLFDDAQWRDYEETARGRVPVADVERRYHPDAFFLRPSYHERFIELLRKSDGWVEAYADRKAIVFVRRRGLKGGEDLRALGARAGASHHDSGVSLLRVARPRTHAGRP